MKKLMVVALMLMVGTGVAYGASLNVPWFVDNAGAAVGNPPVSTGSLGMVFLHNNTSSNVTCSIAYYTAAGTNIGPSSPNNTFVISPNASIAFRPVADDPSSVTGGQEQPSGRVVPNRPSGTTGGNDNAKSGSLVINWTGTSTDVQGVYMNVTTLNGATLSQGGVLTPRINGYSTYGHLLPPGV